ncbi:hypothetical protein Sjap_013455 [Stephania japonica]|uniref:Ycf2 N-terminal domain-containing protein n=1 Tax=Stephania japonica TaxID=461633 RepID=A0AAP0IY44_9MAGN
MPESNWVVEEPNRKKRDTSYKISNETVVGIEISFKEKDIKYLGFPFVSYRDDPIHKDHDWELFDRLSPRKKRNIINLHLEQLFEILVKHWIFYLMSALREKRPIEVEGFFKHQGVGSNQPNSLLGLRSPAGFRVIELTLLKRCRTNWADASEEVSVELGLLGPLSYAVAWYLVGTWNLKDIAGVAFQFYECISSSGS